MVPVERVVVEFVCFCRTRYAVGLLFEIKSTGSSLTSKGSMRKVRSK